MGLYLGLGVALSLTPCYIQSEERRAMSAPKKKLNTVIVAVRIDRKVIETVRKLAKQERRTLGQQVGHMLEQQVGGQT